MKINRRKALIGIGSLAVGSGAALGSGAFTQVNAERTVSVDVAKDANAFLGLQPNSALTTNAISDSGGGASNELEIDLSSTLQNANGSGVNDGAVTTIGEVDDTSNPSSVNTAAFTITNNSANPIDVSVGTIKGNQTDILSLYTFCATTDHDDGTTDFSTVKDLTQTTLPGLQSGAAADVVVVIDTTGGVGSTDGAVTDVTFTASTQ